MEGENTKPKILIFGGTGYLGKYMVKASVASGHKTFVYARPVTQNSRPSKLEIHKEFQGIGVTIIEVTSLVNYLDLLGFCLFIYFFALFFPL